MFIFTLKMQTLAILAKSCKGGRLSTWTFTKEGSRYFATSAVGKRIRARDVDDLRNFYKKMLDWGFSPAAMPADEADADEEYVYEEDA